VKFGVRNFRCFSDVAPVDIRPVTILVGENSTGKTSFLAAYRFISELFQIGANPSFNKDPYSLGSFKEIAHHRGGRAGRATDFSFYLEIPARIRGNVAPDARREYVVGIQLTLTEVELQPSISHIQFSTEGYIASIKFEENAVVSYRTPSMRSTRTLSEPFRLPSEPDTPNIAAMSFLLRDFRFLISSRVARRREKEQSIDEREIDTLRQILFAVERSFPDSIFAGAPVRTKPARTYDNIEASPSPEGAHIPYFLARLKAFKSVEWQRLRANLISFGAEAGLFHDIDVKKFGSSAGSPFRISVNISGPASNLVDVGYGVSQALPVVVETLQAPGSSLFLLQQPEVHLHPSSASCARHLSSEYIKTTTTHYTDRDA
jgi:hypothetical protein